MKTAQLSHRNNLIDEANNEFVEITKDDIETIKIKINKRVIIDETKENGIKFDCVTCKTSVSEYSVDQLLETKMHLD